MRFARFFLMHVPSKSKLEVQSPITIDGVQVHTLREEANLPGTLLMVADVSIQLGELPAHGPTLEIPPSILSRAHTAIQTFSDVFSAANSLAFTPTSPSPCAALIPESEQDKDFLAHYKNVKANLVGPVRMPFRFPATQGYFDAIADRRAGAFAIACFHAQSHPHGKFLELIRMFEGAFASAGSGLYKPVLRFISQMAYGFTKEEVVPWFGDLRNGLIHSDRKLGAPTRLINLHLPRMELAAYDVLMNKANWHDCTTGRRDLWKPACFPGAGFGNIVGVQGKEWKIEINVLDEFGVFPQSLNAQFSSTPEGWFCTFDNREPAGQP
jgi:hypothetical protein